MKLLLIILLFAFMQPHSSPGPDVLLREFIRDAIDTKLSNIQMGDKYFCTNVLHLTDHRGEQARNYLELSLTEQRGMLRTEHISPDEVVFTPFEDLPDKQVSLSDVAKNVYVIQLKGKPLVYVLFKGDKIASTLLISKGGKSCFFIALCE